MIDYSYVQDIFMKILSLICFILLTGCMTTNKINSNSSSNCGYRFGISSYGGPYFDYNCNVYKGN